MKSHRREAACESSHGSMTAADENVEDAVEKCEAQNTNE